MLRFQQFNLKLKVKSAVEAPDAAGYCNELTRRGGLLLAEG